MDENQKRIYELKAEIMQAAGHPIRMAIIDFLQGGEQCVCDIATHVDAKRSNVSRHLALMVKVGILESRKDGLKVIYSLKTPCIADCISCATDVLREKVRQDRELLGEM